MNKPAPPNPNGGYSRETFRTTASGESRADVMNLMRADAARWFGCPVRLDRCNAGRSAKDGRFLAEAWWHAAPGAETSHA